MHKSAIILIAALYFSCASDSEKGVTTDLINNPNTVSINGTSTAMPEITFAEESFDFGDISQGEKVAHSFEFENTGDADLIISSAIGSCGCTVPSYPKEPIKPGEKSVIEVVFDSNGKSGAQHKRVTVVANTNPNKVMVAIMGNVLVPTEAKKE